MAFRPYHTGLKKQVEFKPLVDNAVTMYNCGPTVYGTPHIGNFRSFVFADLLRRYLEWSGYQVRQIMNITDVGHLTEDDIADAAGEDKLLATANAMGWDPYRVARHFEEEFHRDRKKLGCLDAHEYPRATEHIAEMLVLIEELLEKGNAYFAKDSSDVYFDISSFPDYGKLSNRNLEDLEAGARVEVNTGKRHPGDFALWKTDESHLMQWDPRDPGLWLDYKGKFPSFDERLDKGFPGWHVECSAMSMKYLGETFDLHTGGEDNIFPHHECEIAQSTAATGKTFSRYWMHARHLLVNNKKMSKSEGTMYTLADLEQKGYSATELRYLLLSNHYRAPMNFTFEGMDAARASIQRLQTCRDLLMERLEAKSSDEEDEKIAELEHALTTGFEEAMDDDLNTPNALAAVFEFVTAINAMEPVGDAARQAIRLLDSVNEVLGVLKSQKKSGLFTNEEIADAVLHLEHSYDARAQMALSSFNPEEIRRLLAARARARKQRDFATADAIRDGLKAKNIVLEDTKEGVRYKLP